MDFINNAKNSVVDSFCTTKWIFHELQDLKYRVCSLERQKYSIRNRIVEEEKNKDDKVAEVKKRLTLWRVI